jgi:hypothetical protein
MTYSDDGIVWEDPPEILNPRNVLGRPPVWVTRLTPLIERPNEWARIAERPPGPARSLAGSLRKRQVRVPEGEWEFAARSRDGKGYVYARYLGPSDG